MDRWNPLSSKIPYTVFTSHILVRRKKVTNKPEMDIESVVPVLERAVQEYRAAHGKVSYRVCAGGGAIEAMVVVDIESVVPVLERAAHT